MLQNARVTAFTVSDLLRENQQEGKIICTHTHAHTHTHRLELSFPLLSHM